MVPQLKNCPHTFEYRFPLSPLHLPSVLTVNTISCAAFNICVCLIFHWLWITTLTLNNFFWKTKYHKSLTTDQSEGVQNAKILPKGRSQGDAISPGSWERVSWSVLMAYWAKPPVNCPLSKILKLLSASLHLTLINSRHREKSEGQGQVLSAYVWNYMMYDHNPKTPWRP